ncbi:MAG: hypothetical protein N4A50_09550 [Vallitalea sp.]|jgi:Na+/H+ antiporter NhaB|nr:hypothetical protein [Vallitalea sp.]
MKNKNIYLILSLLISSSTSLVNSFVVPIPNWLAIILILFAIIFLIIYIIKNPFKKNN